MSPPPPEPTGGISLLDVGAFLAELALVAALVATASRVAGPLPLRVLLAIALPAALAVVWGRWLSPRAPRRLARSGRILLKVALTVAVAAALATSGLVVVALVLGGLATAILTAGELVGST